MKKVILLLITIAIILILLARPVTAKITDCTAEYSNIPINTQCQVNMVDLHPTQANIGLYQVEYTKAWLNLIDSGKSQIFPSINEFLQQKIVPVVIGPEGKLYMVDNHHTMRAIWDYYQGEPNIKVSIKILQNWQDKSDFWTAMQTNNYTYLGPPGAEINPREIPNSIGDLTDDPYRAAVGMAMQWGFFEKPQGEAKYFYELKWGDCLKKQGFDLGEELDRSEIFRTIAFLSELREQNQINRICNVPVSEGKTLAEISQDLE